MTTHPHTTELTSARRRQIYGLLVLLLLHRPISERTTSLRSCRPKGPVLVHELSHRPPAVIFLVTTHHRPTTIRRKVWECIGLTHLALPSTASPTESSSNPHQAQPSRCRTRNDSLPPTRSAPGWAARRTLLSLARARAAHRETCGCTSGTVG